MRPLSILLLAILLFSSGDIQAQAIITTVAGGGPDGVPALSTNLRDPVGVAVDSTGNLFIADRTWNRVFKVDMAGQLTLVAGNGREGFTGDGGPASLAALNKVSGVAVDAAGNVFIADMGNRSIRRVDANTGIITTLPAGNGYGVAVDTAGNLFIAHRVAHSIRRVDVATGMITIVVGNDEGGFSGDGGPATEARLSRPWGVAVDREGNLFIADTGNHRIRRVDAATGIITTVAGTGGQGLSEDNGPATEAMLGFIRGITVDADGNVYFKTSHVRDGFDLVRRVDAETGMISTVAAGRQPGFSGDGGPATEAGLRESRGVAVDAKGNLFIADTGNQRVRRVDATTGIITTVAGNGTDHFIVDDAYPATSVALSPKSFAIDGDGNLFIPAYHQVLRVDAGTGMIATIAGNGEKGFSGDGGPATEASFVNPTAVAVDAAGNLFIADARSHRIRRVDAEAGIITHTAGNWDALSTGDGGPATESILVNPSAIAVDTAGNLFIADSRSHRVRRVDAKTGFITTFAGTGEQGFDEAGSLASRVRLNGPNGVMVDPRGNVFIVDSDNDRILRVDAETGIISTVAGTRRLIRGIGDGGLATEATLNSPSGVALDRSGNLFIADTRYHRIRRVDAQTGIITSVVGGVDDPRLRGHNRGEFHGDGGPPDEAGLSFPTQVAFDKAGNLYISDNGRIRRVSFGSQPPSTNEPAEK